MGVARARDVCELGADPGERFRPRAGARVDAERPLPTVELDLGATRLDRTRAGERDTAAPAGLVGQQQVDPGPRVAVASELDDRSHGRLDEIEDVGSDVEERAVLEAPTAGECTAEERAGDEAGTRAMCVERRGVSEEVTDHIGEAVGEQHDRADPVGRDRVRDPARAGDVERERLLQEQRPARIGGADRELRLRGGDHGEGDRIHSRSRSSKVANTGTPWSSATDAARSGVRDQHAGQLGLGSGGEERGVHGAGPRSCTGEPDAHGRRHGPVPARGPMGTAWDRRHAGRHHAVTTIASVRSATTATVVPSRGRVGAVAVIVRRCLELHREVIEVGTRRADGADDRAAAVRSAVALGAEPDRHGAGVAARAQGAPRAS